MKCEIKQSVCCKKALASGSQQDVLMSFAIVHLLLWEFLSDRINKWFSKTRPTVCANSTSPKTHMPTSFARTFHVASPWSQWPRRGKVPPKRTALTSLISCCVHWPNRAFVGRAGDMFALPSASVLEPGRTFKREEW